MSVGYTLAAWSLAMATLAVAQSRPAPAGQERIICCEQAKSRLLLLDAGSDWDDAAAVTWSWSAADSPDIRKEHIGWFGYPSDAKPVLGGSHLLTCASHGAVALIRLEDRKVIFYANAGGNPHSVALLPDGNIVSASSEGGYLKLFQTKTGRSPDAVVFTQFPFHDSHGLVWDDKRQCLWAIGGSELKRYRYDAQKPDLIEEATFTLPGGNDEKAPGGHDLALDPAGAHLFLTTMRGVYQFDPATSAFTPYESLGQTTSIKSISQRTAGGPVIVMRATESWWSDTVRFVGEYRLKALPGARFYKARWWPN